MATGVRNLARVAWIKIGAAPYDPNRVNMDGIKVPWQVVNYGIKEKEEKIAALRMLVAMVVAAKHHVREEYESDQYEEWVKSSFEDVETEVFKTEELTDLFCFCFVWYSVKHTA